MNTRAGFTLLEIVLALALLSGVALASASFTKTVIRGERAVLDRTQWSRAAAEALDRIGDDLLVGDNSAKSRLTKVVVSDGTLAVATRSREQTVGPVTARYAHDPIRGVLTRTESAPAGSARARDLIPLNALHAEFDAKTRVLTVQLIGPDERAAVRRFFAP